MGWTQAAALALVRAGELLPWPNWALDPERVDLGLVVLRVCRGSGPDMGRHSLTRIQTPTLCRAGGALEPHPQPW